MVRRTAAPGTKKRRPRTIWDDAKLALLGTVADATLAASLGVTRTTITNKRLELKIPAFVTQKDHKWKASDRKQLGVISDLNLSKKLGICSSQVRNMRLKLGIPAYQNKTEFPAAAVKLLGVEPDSHISERFGMSAALVARERTLRGIGRAPHPGRGDLALPKKAIKDIGWLLDTLVAKKHDVPVAAVRKYREVHGIPPCEARDRKPLPSKAIALLGTMSDGDLARRFGGSAGLYRLRRIHAGIPSYRSKAQD